MFDANVIDMHVQTMFSSLLWGMDVKMNLRFSVMEVEVVTFRPTTKWRRCSEAQTGYLFLYKIRYPIWHITVNFSRHFAFVQTLQVP